MNTNMVISEMDKKHNGTWFKIEWVSDLPLNAAAKKQGIVAYKTTVAQCRKGVNYDAQKSVQEKVANGKMLTHELPWGRWMEHHEGLIIEHKENTYLRVYLGPNHAEVTYFINGKQVTYEELEKSGYLQPSFFKKSANEEKPDALTVKCQNIQKIY